jgi:Fe-S cluster assembly protein SufD
MGKPTNADISNLHELASHVQITDNSVLSKIRETSLRNLNSTSFPTSKDEDWRYLDLKPITRTEFFPVDESEVIPVADIEQYFIPESETSRWCL